MANKTYTLYSGFWRTDGSFVSTIRIKNVLVVAPMDVTPVLFMADGTPYMLHSVHVAVSGVATVNINDVLASAPSLIASHVSQFGSAALIYSYPSPGHVTGQMAAIDASRSLSYTCPFVEPMKMKHDSSKQVLEGLWWKHDRGVRGFVSVSNSTDESQTVNLRSIGTHEDGEDSVWREVELAAHSTRMLQLEDLGAKVAQGDNRAGGIRVEYEGSQGAILVTGGLVNESEGYSANIPFWAHDMSSSSNTNITYASAGLMLGKPDPMMMPGFPKETTFSVYLSLRNASEKPLDVALQLNYTPGIGMTGGAPITRNLPSQHLASFEAKQVGLQGPLDAAGLQNFNGSINLSTSFTGHSGDLVIATGSVDQTGTYVFEVGPKAISTATSQFSNYWSVANGNDTMYSLWNPTGSAQDILVTIYYGDGSGKYTVPVHLDAQASTMIDMAMLIAEIKPDADGNVIPPNIREGSATFSNAKGKNAKISLAIAAGIYNVSTATCGSDCPYCCGDSNFAISPNPIFCPIGETMPCTATATDCYGSTFNQGASWYSSNAAVMTVDAYGNVTGVSAGQATITANFNSVPTYTGVVCYYPCPTGSPQVNAAATVTPKILLGGSNGTDITGQTTNVVVGQQIILYGNYTLPSGVSVNSQSWSVPGTTVGGFNTASTNGGPTATNFSQQSTTFYWVVAASSQTVTFTLNLSDNTHPAATTTFNIAAPTSPGVATQLGQVNITPGPELQFGNLATPGIKLTASATPPSGYSNSFVWVQVNTNDALLITLNNNTSQTCNWATTPPGGDPYLDTSYPYDTHTSTSDSPAAGLDSTTYKELIRNFAATMYLMWTPNLPNAIPVPMGYVSWNWSGDAVYNSSTQLWSVSGSSQNANAFQASNSYPTWTRYSNYSTRNCS